MSSPVRAVVVAILVAGLLLTAGAVIAILVSDDGTDRSETTVVETATTG